MTVAKILTPEERAQGTGPIILSSGSDPFSVIGDAIAKSVTAVGNLAIEAVKTTVNTVADVGQGLADVATGDAFRSGGWVNDGIESIGRGLGDIADGSFVDKDGWFTNLAEDHIPGGGFLTAGFHEDAGNRDHANAAVMKGLTSGFEAAGYWAAGKAGGKLAAGLIGGATGMGSTVLGDKLGDQILTPEQQRYFRDVDYDSMVQAGAFGAFSGVMNKSARDSVRHQRELRDAVNPSGDFVRMTNAADGSISDIRYLDASDPFFSTSGQAGRQAERWHKEIYKQTHGQGLVDFQNDRLNERAQNGYPPTFSAGDDAGDLAGAFGIQPGGEQGMQHFTQGINVQYAGQHDQSNDYSSWLGDAAQHYQTAPGYEYVVHQDGSVSWAEPTEFHDQYGRYIGNDLDTSAFGMDAGALSGWNSQSGTVVTEQGEWISNGETSGWVHSDARTDFVNHGGTWSVDEAGNLLDGNGEVLDGLSLDALGRIVDADGLVFDESVSNSADTLSVDDAGGDSANGGYGLVFVDEAGNLTDSDGAVVDGLSLDQFGQIRDADGWFVGDEVVSTTQDTSSPGDDGNAVGDDVDPRVDIGVDQVDQLGQIRGDDGWSVGDQAVSSDDDLVLEGECGNEADGEFETLGDMSVDEFGQVEGGDDADMSVLLDAHADAEGDSGTGSASPVEYDDGSADLGLLDEMSSPDDTPWLVLSGDEEHYDIVSEPSEPIDDGTGMFEETS